MGRRSDHSRDEIRTMAVRAARLIVENEGYSELTARKVAAAIGYTAGTLYLVFENLDELIMTLNEETLAELRENVVDASSISASTGQRINAMVRAYLDFALSNSQRWRFVFEHRLPDNQPLPESIRQHTRALFNLVTVALKEIGTADSDQDIDEAATALWSGVHGICILALTGKITVGGQVSVHSLADLLVDNFLRGFASRGSS